MEKNYFEHIAWKEHLYTCGIDEVGRGCLSGPLVTAAAILPLNTKKSFLKDSKKMTAQERLQAYAWIKEHAWYTCSFYNVQTIDTKNIYNTTQQAMKKSYVQLLETIPFEKTLIKHLIIDAMPLKLEKSYTHKNLEIHTPTQAESISSSVAAASIVAKVIRDQFMTKLSTYFPSFAFDHHKGYGTKEHTNALKQYGATLIHRKTFISGITKKSERNEQQTIC